MYVNHFTEFIFLIYIQRSSPQVYSTVQRDTNPLLSNELICVLQNDCILQTDKTHCSFSSFFNPLDENEKKKKVSIKDFEVIQLSWTVERRSRTWALEIQHKFHDKVINKSCLKSHILQPWNVRRLELTVMTVMAGEQDNR